MVSRNKTARDLARGRRRSFVKRWYDRALQCKDPYDRFFCLWIALVAAAQRRRTLTGIPFREIYADREKVLEYFECNTSIIYDILLKNKSKLTFLASRKGLRFGQPVLDTRSLRLRRILADFASHYLEGLPIGEEALVEAFAEILNKIRINLFQGLDREDLELLKVVNPLLKEILRRCEFVQPSGEIRRLIRSC